MLQNLKTNKLSIINIHFSVSKSLVFLALIITPVGDIYSMYSLNSVLCFDYMTSLFNNAFESIYWNNLNIYIPEFKEAFNINKPTFLDITKNNPFNLTDSLFDLSKTPRSYMYNPKLNLYNTPFFLIGLIANISVNYIENSIDFCYLNTIWEHTNVIICTYIDNHVSVNSKFFRHNSISNVFGGFSNLDFSSTKSFLNSVWNNNYLNSTIDNFQENLTVFSSSVNNNINIQENMNLGFINNSEIDMAIETENNVEYLEFFDEDILEDIRNLYDNSEEEYRDIYEYWELQILEDIRNLYDDPEEDTESFGIAEINRNHAFIFEDIRWPFEEFGYAVIDRNINPDQILYEGALSDTNLVGSQLRFSWTPVDIGIPNYGMNLTPYLHEHIGWPAHNEAVNQVVDEVFGPGYSSNALNGFPVRHGFLDGPTVDLVRLPQDRHIVSEIGMFMNNQVIDSPFSAYDPTTETSIDYALRDSFHITVNFGTNPFADDFNRRPNIMFYINIYNMNQNWEGALNYYITMLEREMLNMISTYNRLGQGEQYLSLEFTDGRGFGYYPMMENFPHLMNRFPDILTQIQRRAQLIRFLELIMSRYDPDYINRNIEGLDLLMYRHLWNLL